MKKVSMQIVDIDEQTNRNGLVILSIKAKSEGRIYTFAVKEDDYLNEKNRKEFHQGWLKTIKKSQERGGISETEKDKKSKKVKDLIGKEVEEIVY